MINPEFKRNLWLQFSLQRAIGMPAILGLAFLAVHLASAPDSAATLYRFAFGLYIALVFLWGTRNASAAIADELRDKTWDQQRMSAMSPWAMTWAKLFGATAFNWYGGAICLGVMLLAAVMRPEILSLPNLLTIIAAGVLVHAVALALNVHMSRIESRIVQRGGIGGLVMLAALISVSLFTGIAGKTVQWWGVSIRHDLFVLGSTLLFAACAVFAAWRVMSNALQVRTTPWAWPAFAVLLAAYLAGLDAQRTLLFSGVGLMVAGAMTYIALFSEANDVAVWRRVVERLRAGRWREAFEHLPLWPTTLALVLCFALAASFAFAGGAHALSGTVRLWPLDRPAFVYLPLVIALMVLRDAGAYLFFAFADKPRRVEGSALLYLVLMNTLLPFLAQAAGLTTLHALLLPFNPAHGFFNVLIMGGHAALALGLMAWRWRWRRHPATIALDAAPH